MKVILFGASGMVGQGVLRECLLDPTVESVLVIGRSPLGQKHERIREIIHSDFSDFSSLEPQLKGYDACFYCVGVSVIGKTEAEYDRVIYQFTMAAAEPLAKLNPTMTFIFVTGTGTDSTERGKVMWARVKGKTENALLRLPFRAVMFRPGLIQPKHGIQSKTAAYRIPYIVLAPVLPLLLRLLPSYVTSTEQIGRAMLKIAKKGWPKPILETRDINSV